MYSSELLKRVHQGDKRNDPKGVKYYRNSPMSKITNLKTRSILFSSIQLGLQAHSLDISIGFKSPSEPLQKVAGKNMGNILSDIN